MTTKSVRIDADGELRCWNCGSKNLETRRKTGGKLIGATVGVVALGPIGVAGALAAKKRIRCQGCGKYNETGNPQPWAAPDATDVDPEPAPEPRYLVAKKPTRGTN